MMKYKIIGADQKVYGPVGADELRRWIQEGRANGESRVQPDGATEWQPLAAIPELAALLAELASAPQPFSSVPMPGSVPKTNRLAIAGFVCSLVGFLCCPTVLLSILGLVFSLIALGQIRRDPTQEGKGFAIAGIVISALGLIITVIMWIAFFTGFFESFNGN